MNSDGVGPVPYCFAHDKDPSVLIKAEEPLECLVNDHLPKTIVKGYQMILI
jgi:hypothetical protein